jgi:hypothetical protein
MYCRRTLALRFLFCEQLRMLRVPHDAACSFGRLPTLLRVLPAPADRNQRARRPWSQLTRMWRHNERKGGRHGLSHRSGSGGGSLADAFHLLVAICSPPRANQKLIQLVERLAWRTRHRKAQGVVGEEFKGAPFRRRRSRQDELRERFEGRQAELVHLAQLALQ